MVAPGRGMAPPIVARTDGFADVSSMDAVIRDLESRYDRLNAWRKNPGSDVAREKLLSSDVFGGADDGRRRRKKQLLEELSDERRTLQV